MHVLLRARSTTATTDPDNIGRASRRGRRGVFGKNPKRADVGSTVKDHCRLSSGLACALLLSPCALLLSQAAAAQTSAPPETAEAATAPTGSDVATAPASSEVANPSPSDSNPRPSAGTPAGTTAEPPHESEAATANPDLEVDEVIPDVERETTRIAVASGSVLRSEGADLSISEKGDPHIVLPSEHAEVAGELAFITSEPLLTAEETRFSDLGLLRLRVRRSLSDRIEAYLKTALLAKQPSPSDEPIWQSGSLGLRAEVAEQFALGLGGDLGLLMGKQGWWWSVTPSALYKHEASRHLRFLLGAGGTFTLLRFDRAVSEPYWLQELNADAEVQAGDENAAFWVGAHYSVPLASNPSAANADRTHGFLDPQVRLGLDVGGSMSLSADDWNAYAVYSIVDRGELESPATLLPILDGGFDQRQLVIGVQYRFAPEKHAEQNW